MSLFDGILAVAVKMSVEAKATEPPDERLADFSAKVWMAAGEANNRLLAVADEMETSLEDYDNHGVSLYSFSRTIRGMADEKIITGEGGK